MTTSPPAKAESSKDDFDLPKDEGCPNCGSRTPWGPASWCPDCGYYPKLGGKALRSAEEVQSGRAEWETGGEDANLMDAIPAWMLPAIGGSLLILIVNIAARVLLPMEDWHRALITLLELTVGMIVACFAHLTAYLFAAYKSAEYGPMDFIMRPIALWKPTFKKLPEGARRVWCMSWGSTLLFCGAVVIAGYNFDSLFDDWGFVQPEHPNYIAEVVKKARRDQTEEDLEKSLEELMGDELDEPVFLETQCVIIGYTKTETGQLSSVILASAPQGRLAYVGLLSQTDIPEESREDLLKELQSTPKLESCYLKRGVPLDQAIWLEPKLLCRIEHVSWTTQYHLERPTFVKVVRPEEEQKEKEKEERKKEAKKQVKAAAKKSR